MQSAHAWQAQDVVMAEPGGNRCSNNLACAAITRQHGELRGSCQQLKASSMHRAEWSGMHALVCRWLYKLPDVCALCAQCASVSCVLSAASLQRALCVVLLSVCILCLVCHLQTWVDAVNNVHDVGRLGDAPSEQTGPDM